MKQGILPLIPKNATDIDGIHSVFNDGETVTWFLAGHPIRVHPSADHATQRVMMAFLHEHGGVPQARIAAALGVHENTVRAAVRLYRRGGDIAFYAPTAARGPAVMTPDALEECRRLLLEGKTRAEVAAAAGVKKCNVDKAVQRGLLPRSSRPPRPGSTRSERTEADNAAASEMGMACVRVAERALAAFGLLTGAAARFEDCVDVERGGVLCVLPALAANGLLAHLPALGAPQAGGFYYNLTHVSILLAFMALLRVKTVEALRRGAPGEFGKPLGLDRVPEVRCLRGRLGDLASKPESVAAWANALSRDWMAADPDMAGTLYVDGHVRVYHGAKTELPRRYVASHRLCLRGVTDYWVNDREGKPFFYVDRPVDDGLLGALRDEVVPRLLRDVPGQPTGAELSADPLLPRFRLVFDRAGCSPAFMARMWREHRIACMTYRKNPGEDWPETEFRTLSVKLSNGLSKEMELAERGVWFGDAKEGFWRREFRRLCRGKHAGHQTSIVCADYKCALEEGAPAMFARWGQEEFFHYQLAEFGLDMLADHATELFPCRVPVVNPAWRKLDSEARTLRGQIAVAKVKLANLELKIEDMEPGRMEEWAEKKALAAAEVASLQAKLDGVRRERRGKPKHIPFDELPSEHKFERLAPTRKLLLDTIRMVAYRAETALAALARPWLSSPDTARAMIKALFNTAADLHPDAPRQELRVVLHPLAEPRLNQMAEGVLAVLNDAEFTYPGTELRMVYQMLAAPSGG